MIEGGTVLFVKEDRGYFFIQPDAGGLDVFGHVNHIVKGREKLCKGCKATFTIVKARGGKLAANEITII
jgi:cold shock CspA family protein